MYMENRIQDCIQHNYVKYRLLKNRLHQRDAENICRTENYVACLTKQKESKSSLSKQGVCEYCASAE